MTTCFVKFEKALQSWRDRLKNTYPHCCWHEVAIRYFLEIAIKYSTNLSVWIKRHNFAYFYELKAVLKAYICIAIHIFFGF